MNKVCMKCDISKPITDYYKHKDMKDGYLNKCKECTKLDVKTNLEIVGSSYDFSEKGVVRVLYKTQKRNQSKRGHGNLPYTKSEFHQWLYENNFKKLYSEWVESSYATNMKPSVDRLDDYRGYSFANIRLVTWQENLEHHASDRRSGTSKSGEVCHNIEKLDSKGVTIRRYISYQDVRREEGFCVHSVIKNHGGYKNGYYWREVPDNLK